MRQILAVVLLICVACVLSAAALPPTPLQWFVGTFANDQQAQSDTAQGFDPRHLNVQSTFYQHPNCEDAIIAKYTLKEAPFAVVRYRMYRFYTLKGPMGKIRNGLRRLRGKAPYNSIMKLHRPSKTAEAKLRESNYSDSWTPSMDDFVYLKGCDVGWSVGKEGDCFDGVLVKGECKVPSQSDPNKILIAKDNLTLWKDALWVNDRVYDSVSGKQLYGNFCEEPYKFDKAK
jgi:hypothetical protein